VAVERLGSESLLHARLSTEELVTWRAIGSDSNNPGDAVILGMDAAQFTCSMVPALPSLGSKRHLEPCFLGARLSDLSLDRAKSSPSLHRGGRRPLCGRSPQGYS
jgi:hypothetical protein